MNQPEPAGFNSTTGKRDLNDLLLKNLNTDDVSLEDAELKRTERELQEPKKNRTTGTVKGIGGASKEEHCPPNLGERGRKLPRETL